MPVTFFFPLRHFDRISDHGLFNGA